MYLKNRQKKPSQIKATEIEPEGCEDHETYHKLQITDADNSSKWDKTDSECE
ncbi:unnamed protein product [Linum tenue]|uniref:Uncharacterized protein n=1 Tax=Linum tenue TaxID=586396 RepID=A0AAV0MN05_9ROSI|nr:unnamed protein product [Linum tenue]